MKVYCDKNHNEFFKIFFQCSYSFQKGVSDKSKRFYTLQKKTVLLCSGSQKIEKPNSFSYLKSPVFF